MAPARSASPINSRSSKNLTLQNGPHSVSISKDGYRTWQQQIGVSGIGLIRTSLEKIDYRIVVSSEPSGCSVQVDGQDAGTTPVGVSVNRGKHSVSVSRDHYTTRTGSITVSTREQESVSASLTRTEFRLGVTVDPANARVAVDGADVGAGSWGGT